MKKELIQRLKLHVGGLFNIKRNLSSTSYKTTVFKIKLTHQKFYMYYK